MYVSRQSNLDSLMLKNYLLENHNKKCLHHRRDCPRS